ncbi:tetratricopeptide repeat protein [Tenacibaculum sp. M341]|uniref:tetratricopeptide repeat protein n=1 Tax=Tenacibaculum sp. M341 TaxID=2530339 RepID=UPI001044153D|nr:hypothetical protein [Tenacibaculum sp. M341]TCI91509.1 hypothetical protein EYW44_11210 [Tenacibaculum sp. M341]
MSDYLEKIDRYLDGEMNVDEINTFEKELQTNTDLKEAFTLQKEMRIIYSNHWNNLPTSTIQKEKAQNLKNYLTSNNAKEITNTINEVIAENRNVKTLNLKNIIVKLTAAASLIIAIPLIFFFLNKNNTTNKYETLLAKEIQSLPSLINRNDNQNSLLTEGELLFKNKEFKKASSLFSKYQNNNSSQINSLSFSYNGFCFLALNDYSNALIQFKLLQNSNTLQAKKANWYKALVYLKQQKQDSLNSILTQITSNPKNYQYQNSKELLKSLQ